MAGRASMAGRLSARNYLSGIAEELEDQSHRGSLEHLD
jgi:hypothetical protein